MNKEVTYFLTLLLNRCSADDNETVGCGGGKANTQGNEMCALLRAIYYDILLVSLLR